MKIVVIALHLNEISDPREVVGDPAARYTGAAGSRSTRSCLWARRASAASSSRNGPAARGQRPEPASAKRRIGFHPMHHPGSSPLC